MALVASHAGGQSAVRYLLKLGAGRWFLELSDATGPVSMTAA